MTPTREYAIQVEIGNKGHVSLCSSIYEAAIRCVMWSLRGFTAFMIQRDCAANGDVTDWLPVAPYAPMHYVRVFASMHLENWDAECENQEDFLRRLLKLAVPSLDAAE